MKKAHGVQALACRFGSLEKGSHKLKLELHALFPRNNYESPRKRTIAANLHRRIGQVGRSAALRSDYPEGARVEHRRRDNVARNDGIRRCEPDSHGEDPATVGRS